MGMAPKLYMLKPEKMHKDGSQGATGGKVGGTGLNADLGGRRSEKPETCILFQKYPLVEGQTKRKKALYLERYPNRTAKNSPPLKKAQNTGRKTKTKTRSPR